MLKATSRQLVVSYFHSGTACFILAPNDAAWSRPCHQCSVGTQAPRYRQGLYAAMACHLPGVAQRRPVLCLPVQCIRSFHATRFQQRHWPVGPAVAPRCCISPHRVMAGTVRQSTSSCTYLHSLCKGSRDQLWVCWLVAHHELIFVVSGTCHVGAPACSRAYMTCAPDDGENLS